MAGNPKTAAWSGREDIMTKKETKQAITAGTEAGWEFRKLWVVTRKSGRAAYYGVEFHIYDACKVFYSLENLEERVRQQQFDQEFPI